jgi:hypothetical protein
MGIPPRKKKGRPSTGKHPDHPSISVENYLKTLRDAGMSGYQVRGWMAWQHHMALVLVASLYILNIKIQTQKEIELCIKHMQTRHKQREADIDRYFRKRLI